MTKADEVKAALAFVDEFQGDDRCALNCHYAEALAAGYRTLLSEHKAELEQAFREGFAAGDTPIRNTPDRAVAAWRERRGGGK